MDRIAYLWYWLPLLVPCRMSSLDGALKYEFHRARLVLAALDGALPGHWYWLPLLVPYRTAALDDATMYANLDADSLMMHFQW